MEVQEVEALLAPGAPLGLELTEEEAEYFPSSSSPFVHVSGVGPESVLPGVKGARLLSIDGQAVTSASQAAALLRSAKERGGMLRLRLELPNEGQGGRGANGLAALFALLVLLTTIAICVRASGIQLQQKPAAEAWAEDGSGGRQLLQHLQVRVQPPPPRPPPPPPPPPRPPPPDIGAFRRALRKALDPAAAQARLCAVVGSSGALLYDRYGPEIDKHQLVLRFNDAPVAGFEPVVGQRTTVRVLNSQAIMAVIQRCTEAYASTVSPTARRSRPMGACHDPATLRSRRRACCPQPEGVAVLLNTGYDELATCYQRTCGPALNIKDQLTAHPLVRTFVEVAKEEAESAKATALREASAAGGVARAWTRKNGTLSVMSGIYGIAVASLLCERVNVYGYRHPTGPPAPQRHPQPLLAPPGRHTTCHLNSGSPARPAARASTPTTTTTVARPRVPTR